MYVFNDWLVYLSIKASPAEEMRAQLQNTLFYLPHQAYTQVISIVECKDVKKKKQP